MCAKPIVTLPGLPGPNDDLDANIPEDYLLGQKLGVLAYALTQWDQSLLRSGKKHVREVLVHTLIDQINKIDRARINRATLPASTLFILSRPKFMHGLPRERRKALADWQNLYGQISHGRWDFEEKSPRPSQVNAAKLVAHQILYSDARSKAIAEALTAFLAEGFQKLSDDKAKLKQLQNILDELRDATNKTSALLRFANELNNVLRSYSLSGVLVRNALFDHLLAWPVLLFAEGPSRRIGGAISLPIAVDLEFNGRDEVTSKPSNVARQWAVSLRMACKVGKGLWRAKNGNFGRWRDEVLKASVTFDFSVAQRIGRESGLDITLHDRSMEGYFSQVVLAKAMGRHAGFAAAASGQIGPQRMAPEKQGPTHPIEREDVADDIVFDNTMVDENLETETEMGPSEATQYKYILDWGYQWPKGVGEKKKWVYGSHKYDRFVLPPEHERYVDNYDEEAKYIETNHCKYLSGVADCMQIGGWRQFRYIRCDDVAHALHVNSNELPAIDSEQVSRCLSLLANSRRAIVRLPNDIEASALLAAIHHINFVRRFENDHPAPSLAWTCIRAVPEETDLRFWHLLLRRATGTSHPVLARLRLAQSPEAAASIIANELNCLVPDTMERAERAPDLIILLNCRALQTDIDSPLASVMRPLSFEAVISALEDEGLRLVYDERLGDSLGRTRIIIVDTDDRVGDVASEIGSIDILDLQCLTRLKTFRFGFTQQMASVVIGTLLPEASQVRALLQRLKDRGLMTYGGGRYQLRAFHGGDEELTKPRDLLQQARLNYWAGVSFAPYLLKKLMPGLNIAEALLPEYLREAVYHFGQSAQIADAYGSELKTKDDTANRIKEPARLAEQRLLRFFDPLSWDLVNRLAGARKHMPRRETYELAMEILDLWQEAGQSPLPNGLTIAAKAARQWWLDAKKDKSPAEMSNALFSEIIALYEQAYQSAASANNFRSELILHVGSHYSAFLQQFGRNETIPGKDDRYKRQIGLDDQICAALDDGISGPSMAGEWFEFKGDSTEDHAKASSIYFIGYTLVPGYRRNIVKSVGSLALSGAHYEALNVLVARIDKSYLQLLQEFAPRQKFGAINTLNKSGLLRRAIFNRWRTGCEILHLPPLK